LQNLFDFGIVSKKAIAAVRLTPRALVTIGGILIIIFGFLGLIGNSFEGAYSPAGYYVSGALYSVVAIVIGIIFAVGSRSVGTLP